MQQHSIPYFFTRHPRTIIFSLALLALVAFSPSIFAYFNAGMPGIANNKTLLINGWTITPAGQQTALGDLPLNSILSPDGQYILVVNSGAGIQSLQVVQTSNGKVIQTIPYTVPSSVFVGLAYSPDGKHAYASGGGSDVVHTYDVLSSGQLVPTGDVVVGTTAQNPFPTGLSISPDGSVLYVANNLANNVAVIDIKSAKVTRTVAIGTYPYTTLVSADGKSVYASNWGDGTISVLDTASNAVTATIRVGNHPSAMILGPENLLFVADSNSDTISVVNTNTRQEVRRISVALYPHAPLSSSPEGLAMSQDKKLLYVANAGNNDVVVIRLDGDTESVIGKIPTAWYPTSVLISHNDGTLFVTNAKGRGAGPNSTGAYPNPARKNPPIVDGITGYNNTYCNCAFDKYSGSMIVGTLSTVSVPSAGLLEMYTNQVNRNDHVGDTSVLKRDAGNPIPLVGGTSPIKHVIYVVKENRTYDQIFGDLPAGNGDPSLTLFPKDNSPNLHALAEQFTILDNFYADAEVSADGHNWIDSANASDYTEKLWPQNYSPATGRNRGYDFEGGSNISLSPGGYLWDAAAEAGITYRDYGEFYAFDANDAATQAKLIPENQADTCSGPVAHSYTSVTVPVGNVLCFLPMNINPTTPNLVGHYDPHFRTFDTHFREADRFAEWKREFDQFVAQDNLPQLEIVRLPNDHTTGTLPGTLTPQASVAENDLAVGQMVDAVSHSKYWGSTAIFITEDDAQNGPDHVDAHRTEALVVSPYTAQMHVQVDHTFYDTAAMVRTMELILGLRALSQYDAAADPLWRTFHKDANTKPYDVLPETIPLTQTNAATAYDAQQSATLDFSREDLNADDNFNQIIWYAVKGTGVPYPGPTHSIAGSTTQSNGDG